MANTIQMKFSDTSGAEGVPTTELAEGELGINTADGLLWFGNNAATTAATKFNISAFTNDESFVALGTTSSTALAGDTTTISGGQASAISANTLKTGISSAQASAITANTSKTGISSAQASAITANTSKTTNATHSGDAVGSGELTLATVNSNVGTFTNTTLTVNAKGLITAASTGSGGGGETNQNAWGIITVPAGTSPQTAAVDADSIAFTEAGGMTITGGTDTIEFSSADTIYTHPTSAGNIHIPTGGSSGQFLKYSSSGTAVWAADNNTVYTHPTSAGNIHVPTGGSSGQFLKYSSSGTAVWAADNDTVYTHPSSAVTNIDTSTSTIIDSIATNSTGHITAMGTRTLTLANLGYTGHAAATNNTGTVTSITAGSGLGGGTITGSGTITNGGVTSAVAGSGIDVSGATGAVTISIGTGEVVNAMIGNDEINSEHYAASSIDREHLNFTNTGTDGQVLSRAGLTQFTWIDDATGGGSGGGVITATANGVDNRIATYSAATTLNGEANLTFDGTTLTNSGGGIVDSAGQVMSVFAPSMGFAMGPLALSSFGSGVLALDYVSGPSDERLKTDISTLEYGLNEIKALSPKWFKYSETAFNSSGLKLPSDGIKDAYYDGQRLGLMAADVKAVMPKLVFKIESDKDYETYDKEVLVNVLINAVKELEARVATLEG